ncbi:MAG: class I SAM-dependent DNA methyltransferase [Chitinophagaceae bacterium]|nr:class I SAM-dependent DNA methyltransferase [Chitinophagaceae bacterium]
MILSWNEIKDRALLFSKEWADAYNEEAEAKPFLEAFFNIFGITRRKVATFEERVKKLDAHDGYIDLLWKATILVEMKSKGKDLNKAIKQAKDYVDSLPQHHLPKYILVCDFEHFRLLDLEENTEQHFLLKDLVKNVQHFGYLLGYQKKTYKEQDPANIKAAELMGKLHDRLEEIGYKGHDLEVYLVRILFCLFAEDTTIFNKQQFQDYLEYRTSEDGSDLASRLQELFQVLNTPNAERFSNLDESLADFPYVNGKLFEENLRTASFDTKMRQALLNCCYLDWSKISPAIFGSMFQSVMNPTERRNLGAHYTSEKNILKLIKPLFLDELWQEFEKVKGNENKLRNFHTRISQLRFLDPACGCGNFLIIAYRELRLLEIEIVKILLKGRTVLSINDYLLLDVDKFYGIEYEEFPAQIAQVAMWLIDHQLNLLASEIFGNYYIRLPLKKSATIKHGNALRIDWGSLLQVDENYDYIIGNPPFIGSKLMTSEQRVDVANEFENITGSGVLDYVTAWYAKAVKFIQNKNTQVAFVSTNSIVQGEQVSVVWSFLLNKFNAKIYFAHRTFKWSNEAKGNAAVYCIIVGFGSKDRDNKRIFEYEDISGEPHEVNAKNINGYLVDAPNIFVTKRRKPICQVPEISFGSMPNDGGNFLFTDIEKNEFVRTETMSKQFFRPLLSAHEFLNGHDRWCLWLKNAEPSTLKNSKLIAERVERVKQVRESSTRLATKKLAQFPTLFGEDRQPSKSYILIPRHSSENRKYIPFGFFDSNYIVSDSCSFVETTSLFHFGILMSIMHFVWVKNICGRIKSDFRYSNELVYNNFPFPESPTDKQKQAIEEKAQRVLDVRTKYPNSSLADLYDSLTMPPDLVKAHNELDKAVDITYHSQPFTSEAKRMEFLFELYEKYTAGLFAGEGKKKKVKK